MSHSIILLSFYYVGQVWSRRKTKMFDRLKMVSCCSRSSWADEREAGGADSGWHSASSGPASSGSPPRLFSSFPQTAAEDGRPQTAGHGERTAGSDDQED